MSRETLVQAYLEALLFCRLAVAAIPGDGCRVAVGGELAPGEKAFATYYVKPLHVELLLGGAGLGDGPIDEEPAAVATRLEKAARSLHAPYETEQEIKAAAERQVAEIVARVEATNQAGGLSAYNKAYKRYRQGQIDKAERAMGYNQFIEEKYTIPIVRNIASTARAVI